MDKYDRFNPGLFDINLGKYQNKNVIWIRFPYNPVLVRMVKQFTTAHWSSAEKAWHLADSLHNRELCGMEHDLVGKRVLNKISKVNLPEFEKYQNQLVLKGYSKNTIRTYSIEFAQLLYALKDYPVMKFSSERLKSYFLYCIKELRLSENQIHSRINAIKFYFEKVLHRPQMFFDIPRPKKRKRLPKALHKKEVKHLFEVTVNPKHLLILKLCYGMGLRVSEIINIKISDIDEERNLVLIQRGKGKKDRYVSLPQSIIPELYLYYKAYHPKDYLFEGQYGGQYSVRSAQAVFKKAMNKAGIKKKVGIHGLRHSYATHLLEMGTDISLIQQLLGHNSIKTTLLYTEISNRNLNCVRSPLDEL